MPTVDPQSTSTSLLHQIRSGEQAAWFRFVSFYTPLIESWCRRQGIRGSNDIEDIVQKVFVAVWKHIQEYGRNRAENSFRAWLWTITRTKIVDHHRSSMQAQNSLNGELLGNIAAPEHAAESRSSTESTNNRHALIYSALEVIKSDFSARTWAAFWQTCALGQPPSEVAQEMGMTAPAVCMCRARVLRRLRETLEQF
ncbi:MAG: sigma-70 family RNA polymerase sigma factor [Pirellulaceae bacterium]|nr:sigma-70 family RNA polymerase sigma factor [Pirellulaceae bacterium]